MFIYSNKIFMAFNNSTSISSMFGKLSIYVLNKDLYMHDRC